MRIIRRGSAKYLMQNTKTASHWPILMTSANPNFTKVKAKVGVRISFKSVCNKEKLTLNVGLDFVV